MAAVGFTARPHLRLMAVGAVAGTAGWCAGLTPPLGAGGPKPTVQLAAAFSTSVAVAPLPAQPGPQATA